MSAKTTLAPFFANVFAISITDPARRAGDKRHLIFDHVSPPAFLISFFHKLHHIFLPFQNRASLALSPAKMKFSP